ncbi:MAG: tetratricopeptide repeat protein [Alphaproteobacteria bacterium]|nr:tetratricopeptide repeat protein [Alphaproteobacteria bacterium]
MSDRRPSATALCRQAAALGSRGNLAGAEKAIREALRLEPRSAEALHTAAIILHRQGRQPQALEFVESALRIRPTDAALHRVRGAIAQALGRIDLARPSLEAVLRHQPGDAAAAIALAGLVSRAGDAGAAIATLRSAAVVNDDAESLFEIANSLRELGALDAAIEAYRRSEKQRPGDVRVLVNLANCLSQVGRTDDARAKFETALAHPVAPDIGAQLARSYAEFLASHGDRARAVTFFETAVSLAPDDPRTRLRLAELLAVLPETSNSRAEWHLARSLELDDGRALAKDALLSLTAFAALYLWDDPQRQRTAAERWARALESVPSAAPAILEAGGRRLRVGYVSGDFRAHPVANFALPLLSRHDRRRFEVFAYSTVVTPDAITRRFQDVSRWEDISTMSDEAIVARIREDRIDVLVDLAGLTAHARLNVFRRRAAPIQATYLGFAGTTGLSCFDARIVDRWTDPPGMTEAGFVETLLRLDRPFLCYDPLVDVAAAPDVPVAKRGHVTFGSFNHFAKITPDLLAAWQRILVRVPGARLRLKANTSNDAVIVADLKRMIARAGMATDRVDVIPPTAEKIDHLRCYDDIDVALDTHPYGGTTTTCEALWMGVPVVSWAGRTHASRVGLSLLNAVGLEGIVAHDAPGYVDAAVSLAGDRPRLQELRSTLRARVAASPLGDVEGLCRAIEGAYEGLLRERGGMAAGSR